MSRYIPKAVKKAVAEKHGFKCAWCGVLLYENHHIEEYSKGGQHTEENLILLCSNCHTLVHRGEIEHEELTKRKTSDLTPRFGGNLLTTFKRLDIKLGSNYYKDCKVILKYQSKPIIAFEIKNENLYATINYYNENRQLVFWMRRNVYWCDQSFEVTMGQDKLIIKNEKNIILSMVKNGDFFDINGTWNLNGKKLHFTPEETFSDEITWDIPQFGFVGVGSLTIRNSMHERCDPIFNVDPHK